MSGPPPASTARRPQVGRIALGLLLVLVGATWLGEATGAFEVPWELVLPGGLVAVGLALVWLGLRGASSGTLVLLGFLLTALLSVGGVDLALRGGVGARAVAPRLGTDLHDRYDLAVGSLQLDLTDLAGDEGVALRDDRVEANVGIGQLVVIVPEGWRGTAHGEAGIGEVRLLDEERSGFGAETRLVEDGPVAPGQAPLFLHLELSVGIGEIEVRRG
ncbi:MAG TPA: hypothetical protein VNO17_02035 [Actinomycetota bacterium]|nr:hypothetical protein [Actinomycetota bacterium]